MDSGRKGKAPSEVTIRRAKNGGHIVRHSFDNMGAGESYRPSEEHAFSDHKSMMAHVHKHTSGSDKAPDAGETKPTGVAGKPKAAPPTKKTFGAGVD